MVPRTFKPVLFLGSIFGLLYSVFSSLLYTEYNGKKINILDTPGMGRFKIAHPWVSEVDVLPYNALFVDGELVKQWAGGGITRLENRLKRFL